VFMCFHLVRLISLTDDSKGNYAGFYTQFQLKLLGTSLEH